MSEKNAKKDEFQLSIIKTAKDINYTKPKPTNNLVEKKEYEKVDTSVSNGVAVTNAGTTLVKESELSILFDESKKDTKYIIDNKIPKSDKITIDGENYVKSGAVVKETHTRSEEHADAKKRAINHYSEQSLINISQSPDVKSQKGDFEDYAKKKEKKLGQTRAKTNNIHKDEVTDEPLKGNGEFHHKNKKTIFTDPRNRLSPDAGILVNKETHIDIHQNDINDEKALSEYIDNRKKRHRNK